MNCPRGSMKNEIKEITEIITRLQDCGRKRISRTEGVIVNNEDIATALYKAGYRKQSDTVKEFAEKIYEWADDAEKRINEDCTARDVYDVIQEVKKVAASFGKEDL